MFGCHVSWVYIVHYRPCFSAGTETTVGSAQEFYLFHHENVLWGGFETAGIVAWGELHARSAVSMILPLGCWLTARNQLIIDFSLFQPCAGQYLHSSIPFSRHFCSLRFLGFLSLLCFPKGDSYCWTHKKARNRGASSTTCKIIVDSPAPQSLYVGSQRRKAVQLTVLAMHA